MIVSAMVPAAELLPGDVLVSSSSLFDVLGVEVEAEVEAEGERVTVDAVLHGFAEHYASAMTFRPTATVEVVRSVDPSWPQ